MLELTQTYGCLLFAHSPPKSDDSDSYAVIPMNWFRYESQQKKEIIGSAKMLTNCCTASRSPCGSALICSGVKLRTCINIDYTVRLVSRVGCLTDIRDTSYLLGWIDTGNLWWRCLLRHRLSDWWWGSSIKRRRLMYVHGRRRLLLVLVLMLLIHIWRRHGHGRLRCHRWLRCVDGSRVERRSRMWSGVWIGAYCSGEHALWQC